MRIVQVWRVRRRIAPTAETRRRRRVERIGGLVRRAPVARRWAGTRSDRDGLLGTAALGAAMGAVLLAVSTSGSRMAAAAPLGAWIGWRAGTAVHDRERRACAEDARRALPHALDRLSTCVLAGMSVERALRMVAPRTPGVLGEAFADGLRALDLGMPRGRAYQRIAERAGPEEVRGLVRALARAERFGTSVSATLIAQARELRDRARAVAEAEARTVPVKLVFPLVFCFLPAFVLLTIAPIAVSAVRTLGGI